MAISVLWAAIHAQEVGASERRHISIAGSSTVLPFAIVVAEEFGRQFPQYRTPVIESGGSSAGLKLFCAGTGLQHIDIANASRKIKESEREACAKNGVKDVIEIVIGFDGIVFASAARSDVEYALTKEDVFLALGETVPNKDRRDVVANPYTSWQDIRENLPDEEIQFFIPGVKHGTRDVFESHGVSPGCKMFTSLMEAYAEKNEESLKSQCKKIRKDGRSVDIDGDYTVTQNRILQDPGAIGVFGFNFYYLNQGSLRIASIDGKKASVDSIKDGTWPISRPLYFYVKGEHLGKVQGLADYVSYFISDEMIGEEGLLVEKGLIPMDEDKRLTMERAFEGKR
ncbi:MAG: substrate-binding domain-containing protein [Alphaproteobacteria bacterium GM7ARS4]|nr:substrate-binding domain-containing protein [Alphaproteobacteria bacterium GM7ARS4]